VLKTTAEEGISSRVPKKSLQFSTIFIYDVIMRGIDYQQGDMFSCLAPEQRVRKDHPLRALRAMTDEILERMSPLADAMRLDR
jgi:hypothetical protein